MSDSICGDSTYCTEVSNSRHDVFVSLMSVQLLAVAFLLENIGISTCCGCVFVSLMFLYVMVTFLLVSKMFVIVVIFFFFNL